MIIFEALILAALPIIAVMTTTLALTWLVVGMFARPRAVDGYAPKPTHWLTLTLLACVVLAFFLI